MTEYLVANITVSLACSKHIGWACICPACLEDGSYAAALQRSRDRFEWRRAAQTDDYIPLERKFL